MENSSSEWSDLREAGQYAASRYEHQLAHRLFIDKDGGLVWRFQASEGFRPWALNYAIGDEKERSLDHTAAPIEKFRIWADQEAYLDNRSTPVLSYPPEKTGVGLAG